MTPDTLRSLIAASGLSGNEFARTIGRDVRNLRRWLAGGPVPAAPAQQLARLVTVQAGPDHITLVVRRKPNTTQA